MFSSFVNYPENYMKKKQVLYLDRNENQYGPSPACINELAKTDIKEFSNYSRDFMMGYKSCLTDKLARKFGVNEKNIILGYGGEDLLKQSVHCYIHKGDRIMIPAYSWWYYKKIAEEVEGITVEYPIVEGEDSFYYDIEGMLKVYRENEPKLVLISSPNNPTGNQLGMDQLKIVLDVMKDTVVVLDEAYSLFCNGDSNHLKGLVERYPNLLIIRTFSKYHALAGLRIGFALIGEKHERFSLFSARYLGFNCVSERVAMAALDSEEYYRSVCNKMISDIEMYFREFNTLPGFHAYRSFANFILVKIPAEIKDSLKNFLTEQGMIIKFMSEENLNRHIRITIGTQEQNRHLMDLIKSFVKGTNQK
jgi:histidinol-phosphate aminotransferase